MATSMHSTSRQSMATGSSSPLVVEEDKRGYETNLSTESTDTESTKTQVIGLRERKSNNNI